MKKTTKEEKNTIKQYFQDVKGILAQNITKFSTLSSEEDSDKILHLTYELIKIREILLS